MFKLSILMLALVAVMGPSIANASVYDRWRDGFHIQGGGYMRTATQRSNYWCKRNCQKLPGCVAAVYEKSSKKCHMYRDSSDGVVAPHDGSEVYVIRPNCDRLERHIRYEDAQELVSFKIKDVWWCRKKCMNAENCNAFAFNWSTRVCELQRIMPGKFTKTASHEHGRGISSYTICSKYDLLPVCGGEDGPRCYAGEASGYDKWRDGLDIQGGGLYKTITQRQNISCKEVCEKEADCVATTYDKSTKKCNLYKASSDAVLGVSDKKEVYVFAQKCDHLEQHIRYQGAQQLMKPFKIKDVWWCRKKCLHTEGCNAFNFNWSTRRCELQKIEPGEFTRKHSREHGRGISSYTLCSKYEVLPLCGGKDAPLCYANPPCDEGLSITSDETCECGREWQNCCDGKCDAGYGCNINDGGFGQCSPCGGEYEVCCPGELCNSEDGLRTTCVHGQCHPCGGEWQPRCDDNPPCNPGLKPDPHAGTQCMSAVPKW